MILMLESVTDSIWQLGAALISLKLEDLPSCMDPVEGLFTFQPGPDAETLPTLDVTESLQPFTHLVYGTEQYSQVQSILSLKTRIA